MGFGGSFSWWSSKTEVLFFVIRGWGGYVRGPLIDVLPPTFTPKGLASSFPLALCVSCCGEGHHIVHSPVHVFRLTHCIGRGQGSVSGGALSAVRAQCNYLGVWPY